eukprot:132987_1
MTSFIIGVGSTTFGKNDKALTNMLEQALEESLADCALHRSELQGVVSFPTFEKELTLPASYYMRKMRLGKHYMKAGGKNDDPVHFLAKTIDSAGASPVAGTTREQLASTAAFMQIQASRHPKSVQNPHNRPFSLQDILNSREIASVTNQFECARRSDGAACIIVASEAFVRKRGLSKKAVQILGYGYSVAPLFSSEFISADDVDKLDPKVFGLRAALKQAENIRHDLQGFGLFRAVRLFSDMLHKIFGGCWHIRGGKRWGMGRKSTKTCCKWRHCQCEYTRRITSAGCTMERSRDVFFNRSSPTDSGRVWQPSGPRSTECIGVR